MANGKQLSPGKSANVKVSTTPKTVVKTPTTPLTSFGPVEPNIVTDDIVDLVTAIPEVPEPIVPPILDTSLAPPLTSLAALEEEISVIPDEPAPITDTDLGLMSSDAANQLLLGQQDEAPTAVSEGLQDSLLSSVSGIPVVGGILNDLNENLFGGGGKSETAVQRVARKQALLSQGMNQLAPTYGGIENIPEDVRVELSNTIELQLAQEGMSNQNFDLFKPSTWGEDVWRIVTVLGATLLQAEISQENAKAAEKLYQQRRDEQFEDYERQLQLRDKYKSGGGGGSGGTSVSRPSSNAFG